MESSHEVSSARSHFENTSFTHEEDLFSFKFLVKNATLNLKCFKRIPGRGTILRIRAECSLDTAHLTVCLAQNPLGILMLTSQSAMRRIHQVFLMHLLFNSLMAANAPLLKVNYRSTSCTNDKSQPQKNEMRFVLQVAMQTMEFFGRLKS